MRPKVTLPDLDKALSGHEDAIGVVLQQSMSDATSGMVADLRDSVRRAGLGARLANTWRARTYPAQGGSLDPAGLVWSKAPKLIDAYTRGAVIVPLNGQKRLAIPTKNVPLKGRGKRMTPLDVEGVFNQDLILRPGKGDTILAFINAVQAKNRKGWRQAARTRLAQGREVKLVLMFELVRSVTVHGRLEPIEAVAERWGQRLPGLVADRWR